MMRLQLVCGWCRSRVLLSPECDWPELVCMSCARSWPISNGTAQRLGLAAPSPLARLLDEADTYRGRGRPRKTDAPRSSLAARVHRVTRLEQAEAVLGSGATPAQLALRWGCSVLAVNRALRQARRRQPLGMTIGVREAL